MPDSPPRRLNLVDGMILIAGSAACFLLTRYYLEAVYPELVRRVRYAGANPFWLDCYVVECLKVGTLWLGVFSPLILLIRLRQPRPDFADLLRQPGTVANGAATLIVGLGIVQWWLIAVITGEGLGSFLYRVSFAHGLTHSGAAVVVAWTLLVLSRQWSPERTEIDRAGRFLGVCWIITWLAATATDLHQSAVLTSGGVGATSSFSYSNLIDH